MARFRGSSSRRVSGTRRQTSWAEGPFGTITGVTTNSTTVFSVAQQAVEDGLTIVRTRGELLVFLSASIGAFEGFRWGFGMGIVSQNAAGIGVTAVPQPLVDVGWDGWFVYETGTLVQAQAVTTIESASNSGSSFARIMIDSKAMWKFKNTDVIVAVLEVDSEVGAANFEASLSSRFLAKLS